MSAPAKKQAPEAPRTVDVIGRGLVGWHAAGREGPSTTFSSSGGTLEEYTAQAKDGALVYDAQDADRAAFSRFVIDGPMVSGDLEPGKVRRFGADDKAAATRMLPGLQDAFRAMATAAIHDWRGLDTVAPDVYATLLRARVPGIKIGTVQAGRIVWET